MSDLNRVISPPSPAPYRIVTPGAAKSVMSYMHDIDLAKQFADDVEAEIEAYVYGIGWVPWVPAMSEKGRHE
jgi:hypothetical protein